MKINRISVCVVPLFVIFALAIPMAPVLAQEEDDYEDNGRFGAAFAELELWVAQGSGFDFYPATRSNPADPFDVELLSPGYSTENRGRYRAGYRLNKNLGALVVTYYSHEEETELSDVSPGNFIYGELLPVPTFAGFANDGMADAFDASTRSWLRDLRIDYYRTAFDTPRVRGKWFVGWRRVKYGRDFSADYYALIPDLPPLIPPFYDPPETGVGLAPEPDSAAMSSNFNGRGLGAGLEVEMPLWKDKLLLEGGLNVAILRGKTDASYQSTTWYYLLQSMSGDIILEAPYDEFEQVDNSGPVPIPLIDAIVQERSDDGLHADSLSSTAHVVEVSLGFRWKAYKGLDWFGGFRSTRYTDVGTDIRSTSATAHPGPIPAVSEQDRSATYEGFYTGIAYSY
jgi:hypothetical protein